MTKDELKRKQYDTWNRYYQKHKSEINARRKKVREDYKNKLSIADKRIAELEAQIEKMKCCDNCQHCGCGSCDEAGNCICDDCNEETLSEWECIL